MNLKMNQWRLKMKIAILLTSYTIEKEDCTIKIIPKGTVLYECYDGGGFSTVGDGGIKSDHLMTIGCNYVYNNPHVFLIGDENGQKRKN